MSVFCTNCGKDIPEQSQFCPMCGTVSRHTISAAVAIQEIKTGPFCPSCGRRTVEGSGFCIWCGVDIHMRTFGDKAMACPMCGGKIVSDANFCSGCRNDLTRWFKGDGKKILSDRYRLDEEIGSGGMGIVYKAFDLTLKMEVAVKTVPPELARNKSAVDQLRSEAQTALKITHPNITRLYTFEEDGEDVYLVMEYVPGDTLEKIVREKGKYSEERAIKIGLEVLKGLGEAHANKVIHRDLKPGNIIVQPDRRVKILDFGIARKIKETMTRFSAMAGPTSGTLLYMAPEQIRGKHETAQTDIYSFGAVMYEMLSGNPPFFRGAIEHQILNEQPAKLEGVSESLNAILMRCMAKESSERYKSTVVLLGALNNLTSTDHVLSVNKQKVVPEGRKTSTHDDGEVLFKCRKAAERGDGWAQYQLGKRYYEGNGVRKDAVKTVEWFQKAAEKGVVEAQFNLGMMYLLGDGINKDESESAKFISMAAKQDYMEAVKLMKEIAEKENSEAQYFLAEMYVKGEGVQKNDQEAGRLLISSAKLGHSDSIKWLKEIAAKGDVWASFNLGMMYMSGEGVKKDESEAIKLIFEVAKKGNDEAIKWIKEIAEKGNAEAQFNLGIMYELGEGVGKDERESRKWKMESFKAGFHFSGKWLLEVIIKGDREAMECLKETAESGIAEAQFLLGWMFYYDKLHEDDSTNGIDWFWKTKKKRLAEAAVWLRKSAEQGNCRAQGYIGRMYEEGKGVKKDKKEAGKWIKKATEQVNANRPPGVWIDPFTRLMWQNPPAEKKMKWNEAMEYAKELNLGGLSGWRLPTIEELKTLLRKEKSSNGGYWPQEIKGEPGYYWSSSLAGGLAWRVAFNIASINYDSNINNYHVRCVWVRP